MIKIVSGDLLNATENIIGHQVNCQGKMNSGIAKQIRETYPKAFKEYLSIVKEYKGFNNSLLGKMQGVKLHREKYIANLFGQDNYGYDNQQYTDTNFLYLALKDLRKVAEENQLSVALPYMIGCYRGGADWTLVEGLIITAFEGYEVTLYKLHKG